MTSDVGINGERTNEWRTVEAYPPVFRGRGKELRIGLTENPSGGLFLNVRQWLTPEHFPLSDTRPQKVQVNAAVKGRKRRLTRSDVPAEGLPDKQGLTVGSPAQLEELIETLARALISWESRNMESEGTEAA